MVKIFYSRLEDSTPKHQHEAGLTLLKSALELELNYKGDIRLDKSETGKPFLLDFDQFRFNISHCKGMAVLALSDGEVGIDVEGIRKYRERIVERIFTPEEKQYFNESMDKDLVFTKIWTAKESFIKNIGLGLSYPMEKIELEFIQDNILIKNINDYYIRQFNIDNFTISLCTKSCTNIKNVEVLKRII